MALAKKKKKKSGYIRNKKMLGWIDGTSRLLRSVYFLLLVDYQ